jgi:hypothetical protein
MRCVAAAHPLSATEATPVARRPPAVRASKNTNAFPIMFLSRGSRTQDRPPPASRLATELTPLRRRNRRTRCATRCVSLSPSHRQK